MVLKYDYYLSKEELIVLLHKHDGAKKRISLRRNTEEALL
jgi:hypothetical protein